MICVRYVRSPEGRHGGLAGCSTLFNRRDIFMIVGGDQVMYPSKAASSAPFATLPTSATFQKSWPSPGASRPSLPRRSSLSQIAISCGEPAFALDFFVVGLPGGLPAHQVC
jgi:hypothetical protein